ncbi:mediator of RNA polymerase II transcription subunit 9 isoform X1 [Strix aluco]|uniref:mediator of RNA polymerase II transcription subunit 9 isoform X1 n=2 Tax=Strix aluco TaxID=111821 RepID=UPI003DA1D874
MANVVSFNTAAIRRAQPCCFDTDSAMKTHLQGDSVLGSEDVSCKFAYIQGRVLFPVVWVRRKFSQAGLADIFNLVQSNSIAAEVPAYGSMSGSCVLLPHLLTPACPCPPRGSRFSGLIQQENHPPKQNPTQQPEIIIPLDQPAGQAAVSSLCVGKGTRLGETWSREDIGLKASLQLCMDKDSQDVHQVLNELKNKFQEMRKLISSMPGIGVSPEQQQQQLQNLREQVRTKNELLQKYKSLCMFEIPKE